MFIPGIIIGSFITTIISKEFTIVKPNKKALLHTLIGSALMGVGAIWGQGCLVGNGLVGTAQFSVKSWYSLMFIIIGIWSSSYIFLVRDLQKH